MMKRLMTIALAAAPALGIIKAHFATAPRLLVQLIVSMPALLIIITNIFFLQLSRRVNTRAIATTGLMLYVAAGAGCFFVDDIFTLLLMRAILGISVGLIMPLSTGLLADDITGPYKAGCLLSIVFLLQVWATRHFQSLPPQKD